jgi:transposase
MEDEFFTVKEVAEMFKVSTSTIYKTPPAPAESKVRRVPPVGTERQMARNRANNLRNRLKERPLS